MAKLQTGLGRGLDALISDVSSIQRRAEAGNAKSGQNSSLTGTLEIDVNKIEPNPYQPRAEFSEELIAELAESIKVLGLIQPITVRETSEGKYQIISGERRYRASKMAGLSTIPAYIKKTDNQGMLEMAIVENIQRENLISIEIAISFQRLMDECNLTQEAMSQRVGKKRATVANYLRLLKLPPVIQIAIRENKITMGHAKALLGLEEDKEKIKVTDTIIKRGLSVRETEALVQKMNNPSAEKGTEEIPELPPHYCRVIEALGRFCNNNVSAKRSEKGIGTVTLHFSGDQEFNNFLTALEQSGLCTKE